MTTGQAVQTQPARGCSLLSKLEAAEIVINEYQAKLLRIAGLHASQLKGKTNIQVHNRLINRNMFFSDTDRAKSYRLACELPRKEYQKEVYALTRLPQQ